MDLSRIPIFEAIAKRMSWLGERHAVLAQNVANADTPGYVAKDVKAPDFSSLLAGASQKLGLTVTQPNHVTPVNATLFKRVDQPVRERSPNGNAVQIEDQMVKVSETASDFALTTSLYRQQLGLLKLVLGRGPSG